MKLCTVCGKKVNEYNRIERKSSDFFDCPYCGRYVICDLTFLKDFSKYKHILAGYLYETNREMQYDAVSECICINSTTIKGMLSDGRIPKTMMQKMEKLLLYYYKKNDCLGHEYTITTQDIVTSPAVAYVKEIKEIFNMITEMGNLGWFHVKSNGTVTNFRLSAKGYEHAEQLISTNIDSKKAFIAMKFNNEMYAAVDNAIRPAVAACGFTAFPVYDKEHNNDINDEIIAGIKSSKFMIADFTYNSYGAYFEAGYAQGLGLEVIRTCNKKWLDEENEKGERNKLHFDVEHYSFIIWENYNDLIKQLKNRIRATIAGAVMTDKDGDGDV